MFRNPTTDLIVVLVIVLLIFGPKRLPALGRSIGSGLREFKDSITGGDKDSSDEEERPELTAATEHPAPPAAPQPSGSTAQPTAAPAAPEPQAAVPAAPQEATPARESAEVGSPERRS